MMKEDGVPRDRSATGRFWIVASRDNPPHDFRKALAKIVQETIAFWCGQLVNAGIPTETLYPHVAAPHTIEGMNAPIWTAFNKFSRPGWTTYAVGGRWKSFSNPSMTSWRSAGIPPGRAWRQTQAFPGSAVDWETYLGWHYNHGCILVGIIPGATGQDLPKRLWQSASVRKPSRPITSS